MVRNKIYLAGREFASLTAARVYVKAILDKYNSGDCVNEEEADFLKAAIALRGPEKLKEKIGAGIESIFIHLQRASLGVLSKKDHKTRHKKRKAST